MSPVGEIVWLPASEPVFEATVLYPNTASMLLAPETFVNVCCCAIAGLDIDWSEPFTVKLTTCLWTEASDEMTGVAVYTGSSPSVNSLYPSGNVTPPNNPEIVPFSDALELTEAPVNVTLVFKKYK